MAGVREALEEAAQAHSPVRIVYHGGSQPGATREITPIAITDDRVRARCHVSGQAKVFLLSKMQLAAEAQPDYVPEEALEPEFADVSAVHQFTRDTFEGMGFAVQYSASENHERLSIHRVWKNGRPMKGSEVELQFDPILRDWVMDVDDSGELIEREVARTAERPYLIRAKSGYTARFVSLDRAAKKFLDIVEASKL